MYNGRALSRGSYCFKECLKCGAKCAGSGTLIHTPNAPQQWACPGCDKHHVKEGNVPPYCLSRGNGIPDVEPLEPLVDVDADATPDFEVVDGFSDDNDETILEASDFKLWSAPHMRWLMGIRPNFLNVKSHLQELIESRGHMCLFTPKFHAELAFVELYWAKSKRFTRKRSDGTWRGLKAAIWRSVGE
jgi:hypothetical protein